MTMCAKFLCVFAVLKSSALKHGDYVTKVNLSSGVG